MYAVQKMGKVPAMLNFSLGGRSLVNCCKSACVKTVVTSRKFVELGKLEALVAAVEEEGMKVVWLEDLAPGGTGECRCDRYRYLYLYTDELGGRWSNDW